MSPMRDLQLVIFDCDGVLVDSEVISNEVLARALTAEGLPTTLPEARRDFQGLLLADIRSSAQAKLGREPCPTIGLSNTSATVTRRFAESSDPSLAQPQR
jgi:beta-phosphoglucomutase-like phosphatase (HAD superfamily)